MCKGGDDQGCRHLGATLFELNDFPSNQRKSVNSRSAYWNPMPTPTHKPVPMSEMKVSKSSLIKRKVTPYDDSWIDSFDSRPMKGWKEITHIEKKLILQRKLEKSILVLVFLIFYNFPQTIMKMKIFLHILIIIYLTWPYCLKLRIMFRQIFNKLSEDNLSKFAEEFLKALTFSDNDRIIINKATMGQHKNKTCMRWDTF